MTRRTKTTPDPVMHEEFSQMLKQKPTTLAEFSEYTKKFFGIPLHLKFFEVTKTLGTSFERNGIIGTGRYEILENHDKYYKTTRYKYLVQRYQKDLFGCYDLERFVFQHAIAPLSCGGIARTNYGQFEITDWGEFRRLRKLYWQFILPYIKKDAFEILERSMYLDLENDKSAKDEFSLNLRYSTIPIRYLG